MKYLATTFFAFTIAVTACEMEPLNNDTLTLKAELETPEPDCAYLPCDQAISETKQAYQHLANSLQDTIWVDITCCNHGMLTYALVVVVPYIKTDVELIPMQFMLQ